MSEREANVSFSSVISKMIRFSLETSWTKTEVRKFRFYQKNIHHRILSYLLQK